MIANSAGSRQKRPWITLGGGRIVLECLGRSLDHAADEIDVDRLGLEGLLARELDGRSDLSGVTLGYLFLDGSHFKFHAGSASEPVLAAWGVTTDGRPVLVGLAPGESESHDAWAEFLRDLTSREMSPPLLVISNGAPGLIGACEVVLAKSLRQRCLIHRCRNILAKVPKSAQGEVKAAFWKLFDDVKSPPGQRAVAEVRARIKVFAEHYQRLYPAAVKCLLSDVESLTAYLRFPSEHHKRIRHSNFISSAPSVRRGVA